MKTRNTIAVFIAGAISTMVAQAAYPIATASADSGQVEALREIAAAIRDKDCK